VFPTAELLVFTGVRAFDPARALDEIVDVVIERGKLTRVGRSAASLRALIARTIDVAESGCCPRSSIYAHLRAARSTEEIATGLPPRPSRLAHTCAPCRTRNRSRHPRGDGDDARGRPSAVAATASDGAITVSQGERRRRWPTSRSGCVAVSDDGVCVMSASVMRRALEYARNFDLPVIQHAEDHNLTRNAEMHEGEVSARLGLRGWPSVAEDVIVARDVLLAEYVGARYHVAHLSSRGAVRIVRGQNRGIGDAEVTPLPAFDRRRRDWLHTACR
jgi:dihydroorotase